ncbi:MAG: hypothetical protein PHF20_05735 [Halothiobacillaceae bacterium]|nr:hypothetical protein [Halothiobacillaceae bacterium]
MGKTNLKTAKNRRFSGNSVPQAKKLWLWGINTGLGVFRSELPYVWGGCGFSPMQYFLQRNLELGI